MNKELPLSPDHMPAGLYNDLRWLSRTLMDLKEFECVDIHIEKEINDLGENVGICDVDIETRQRRLTAKHKDIRNALWFATTLADQANEAELQRRDSVRKNALAKLSQEERQSLGI